MDIEGKAKTGLHCPCAAFGQQKAAIASRIRSPASAHVQKNYVAFVWQLVGITLFTVSIG